MRDAKLFTIGCGERFRRLSSPLVNNFGKAIRVGERGKSLVLVDQIHAQPFDATPTLCPSALGKGRWNAPPKCGASCGLVSNLALLIPAPSLFHLAKEA